MSSSVDPDETAHYLNLCCLQMPTIIARGSESVKVALILMSHFVSSLRERVKTDRRAILMHSRM